MQILDTSIFMPTMSGPINPIDPGYGAIFPSGSRIFMSNSLGELYDLTDSKGYLNVVVITGSSNSGWTKPGGLAYAHVICVGGAGGGAGGRQGAANTIRGGGGAGAGASINQTWFNASQLPDGPYTTSIALPAAGGLGGTAINTNGQNGANGNFSYFVQSGIVYAAAAGTLSGGGAPRGGSSTAGGGGNLVVGTITSAPGTGQMINSALPSPLYSFGNNAPNGFPTTVGNAANFPARGAGFAAAGGGGGGITAANATSVGGSGSAPIVDGSPAFSGAPTAAGVGGAASNGADNAYDFLQIIGFTSSVSCSFGLGGGGHGGGSGDLAGTVAGSDGGNGGLYGAGGGAGGGSTNGARGGNGGSGSGGCIIIVEYY